MSIKISDVGQAVLALDLELRRQRQRKRQLQEELLETVEREHALRCAIDQLVKGGTYDALE